MKQSDPDSIDKNISVNEILLKLTKKPMKKEDFLSVERYYNALKSANLIDIIGVGHFYDKQTYDFYFVIEDASKNWSRKVVLKKTMADLILKYGVIDYIIIKNYHFDVNTPELVKA
jgi:hypothetical protein